MEHSPPITLSSLDAARLYRLLDREAYRHLPGADALRDELDRAVSVAPADMPPGVVTMNSTVRFIDDSNGSTFELKLVYPEASGAPNTVSVLAPIGSALLGLSVGQSIPWQVPGGRQIQLRVLEVLMQPEALGDYDS
jgi:regulator of nucleoside diphosphate kinase